MHFLLPCLAYICLILGFICAWLPDISSDFFWLLLVTVLLEFVIIQFHGFAGLYAEMAPDAEECKRRRLLMFLGIVIFSLGIGISYRQPFLVALCWLLFLTRILSSHVKGADGSRRVYALFRWVFDSLIYILLAIALSLLPVPGLFLKAAVQQLGFITAGPWVDYPELAAAQGFLYFSIQLIVFLKRNQIVEWLDRVASR